jgi:hypothetical protein
VRSDFADHVESVELGHLHVEEYQVRWRRADLSYRFRSGRALPNYLEIRSSREERAQSLACEVFVVDDQHSNWRLR